MAHHQHHGADYEAQLSRSLASRPVSPPGSNMPAISEDETAADVDEPPDGEVLNAKQMQAATPCTSKFSKHPFFGYFGMRRRQSLLTRALTTDSESHDDDPAMPSSMHSLDKLPSVSSICSNPSVRSRSQGDFTSDDGGHVSPSTRPSTPGSPRSVKLVLPPALAPAAGPAITPILLRDPSPSADEKQTAPPQPEPTTQPASPNNEDAIAAQLGRRRCIMFSCGKRDGAAAETKAPAPAPAPAPAEAPAEPAKRPNALKFFCPSRAAAAAGLTAPPKLEIKEPEHHRSILRKLSPAPAKINSLRRHRDSDTTIRDESPTTPRAALLASPRRRRFSQTSARANKAESSRLAYASSDEEQEDWLQQTSAHKTRLTVDDTLKKENVIRRLGEECEEEEAASSSSDHAPSDSDSDSVSDTGFQTDDEEGFAESDDDEEAGESDYEWWAPRSVRRAGPRGRSPYVGHDVVRPVSTGGVPMSTTDDEDDDDELASPRTARTMRSCSRGRRGKTQARAAARARRAEAIPVINRPSTPELPDSTDFVCGTLDEDRPMEAAYLSCVEQRRAAKHRVVPQDIDPSFPVSDPEIGSDDDEEQNAVAAAAADDGEFLPGHIDIELDEAPRGRARDSPPPLSTRRHASPAPALKKCAGHRSPAPLGLFQQRTSPRRYMSPVPRRRGRLVSPPPSRRGSTLSPIGIPFFGARNADLEYTASLPRSPHTRNRRRLSGLPGLNLPGRDDHHEPDSADDDAAALSDRTTRQARYHRGAIDIAQGLETKRLKRREKFYQRYLRKEEKRERKATKGAGHGHAHTRPTPGRGAERMRQIGLECAVYRGTRMLSI